MDPPLRPVNTDDDSLTPPTSRTSISSPTSPKTPSIGARASPDPALRLDQIASMRISHRRPRPLSPTFSSRQAAPFDPSGWKSLKPFPLEEKWEEVLPVSPVERHRIGTLANGMLTVQRTFKPKDRAALALAVDVGSIAEELDERGVAHLVEHLAFRATENNDNFAIVRFLESIGAEFGACQNAYTSMGQRPSPSSSPSTSPTS